MHMKMSRCPTFEAELDRRRFLMASGALWLGWTGCTAADEEAGLEELWLSAAGDDVASYGLALFAPATGRLRWVRTGFRGHGIALLGDDRAALVARRPGNQLVVVKLSDARIERTLEAPEGRIFQGHAVALPTGELLTTEADRAGGAGFIGVWSRDGTRLDEHSTHGVGPHELLHDPARGRLFVANGGYATLPDGSEGGFETMAPSLVELAWPSAEVLRTHVFSEPKASVRHMGLGPDGTLGVGLQVKRAFAGHDRPVPLCGLLRPGSDMVWLDEGLPEAAALDDYVGSVAVSLDGESVGYTSPRGDVALFFATGSGKLLGYERRTDVCGLAARGGGFVMSASTGQLAETAAAGGQVRSAEARFDNHLVVRPAGRAGGRA